MNARLVYRSDPCRFIKVLMTAHLVHRNARSMPWAGEKALTLTGNKTRLAMTRARGHQNLPFLPRSRIAGFWGAIVGPKDLATPAHFISGPRPTPRRKKCPRTNKEGLNCQEMLLRTILFSASRDHGRRKRHATKGGLSDRPKGKHKCNEIAMGV